MVDPNIRLSIHYGPRLTNVRAARQDLLFVPEIVLVIIGHPTEIALRNSGVIVHNTRMQPSSIGARAVLFSYNHCREILSEHGRISTTGVTPRDCGGRTRVGPIIPAHTTSSLSCFSPAETGKAVQDGRGKIVPIDGLTDLGAGGSLVSCHSS